MSQLMPLSPTVSCFGKIQIGLTFLVPAHPGSPRQTAVTQVLLLLLIKGIKSVPLKDIVVYHTDLPSNLTMSGPKGKEDTHKTVHKIHMLKALQTAKVFGMRQAYAAYCVECHVTRTNLTIKCSCTCYTNSNWQLIVSVTMQQGSLQLLAEFSHYLISSRVRYSTSTVLHSLSIFQLPLSNVSITNQLHCYHAETKVSLPKLTLQLH